MNYNFEWDANKAKSNIAKHNVSFEDSVSVFRDKNMISLFDDEHSESEDRWVSIGMDLPYQYARCGAYIYFSR
ncbi:MAG: BrnT family toxin [Sulfurimonas sp.]|nr:BrnT family toxin [Sulfurimonas sp.]